MCNTYIIGRLLTRVKRLCWTLLLTTALTSCSRVQIVYNQLDWLLPYYLETYVELSADQDSYLEQEVKRLLTWHCSTQLASYAGLLRAASGEFRSSDMSRKKLAGYSNRIEQYWRDILLQSTPAITVLLLDANESQIEELFSSFSERNREWLDEFNDITEDELRSDYAQRMARELERWFGPLQPAQVQSLQAWSRQFQPLGTAGLQMRMTWQARLKDLLEIRGQQEDFRDGMYRLINNPESMHPTAYRQLIDNNRELTITLIHAVGDTLSQEQRHHLDHQAEAFAQDFENLACEEDEAGPLAGEIIKSSQVR